MTRDAVGQAPCCLASRGRQLRGECVVALARGRCPGAQALDVLRELALRSESVALIVSDFRMPEMTGIDVYEELAVRAPALLPRIVFVTGGAFTASARQFLEHVPNRQVSKPFEARQLRLVAQEVAALGDPGQFDRRRSG